MNSFVWPFTSSSIYERLGSSERHCDYGSVLATIVDDALCYDEYITNINLIKVRISGIILHLL